jgi:hypothetical protein
MPGLMRVAPDLIAGATTIFRRRDVRASEQRKSYPDRISMAFGSVMSAIIESTPDGPARAQAVLVVMEAHGAVRALLVRNRLN